MKTKLLLFAFLLFNLSGVNAQKVQNLPKVQFVLDYHYNLGIIERGDLYNINRSDYHMYGNSLRLSALYNLNPKLALGAGIGLDRYEAIGHNTLPVFATCYYSPLTKLPRAYVYSNLGYAIGNETHFTRGMLFDLGIGYRKMFKKHFGLNFQIGYNLKQFRGDRLNWWDTDEIVVEKYSQFRHSLSIGFGFIF
ncbi:hypothetical protein [Bacteroides sp. 519]|uniref:hypothetical protein n=1 Tax=Bacteroides sp. 519 TaxID=2302937 RepID=UPI0013D2E0FA|nr:hypothetical protein [Bacteroides sp. 519]NDV57709.1 hypothetical protein [Bacteroides sp. 519]